MVRAYEKWRQARVRSGSPENGGPRFIKGAASPGDAGFYCFALIRVKPWGAEPRLNAARGWLLQ